MDDNTRQVLVALVTVLGGLLTGTLVAKLGFDHARRIERDRWRREDRDRNRAERIAAYSAFLVAMESRVGRLIQDMNAASIGVTVHAVGPSADPQEALQTITILAPSVTPSAETLYNYVKVGMPVIIHW